MTTTILETPRAATGDAVRAAELVRRLDERLDPSTAGSKAAVLSRIRAFGIPVPEGIVLTTTAFSRWLDGAGLRSAIERVTRDADRSDPQALAGSGSEIRRLAMAAPLPFEVEIALDDIFAGFGGRGPLVVRSSGVGEDGRQASFAGQLDSVLHVRSRSDLTRAVRQCWTSYWSDRALSYRHARGVSLDGMAVLIQRQIAPSLAGVLFTQDPQDASSLVVEYCRGLADDLVSGHVDPDRVRVRRRDVARTNLSGESRAIADTGLLSLSLGLERLLGGPQDIEWAIDESGTLWIVQARPITCVSAAAREPESPRYWSNANVNENFPAPISPLLYSIASTGYYHYFRNLGLAFGVSRRRIRAMDHALQGIIGVHGARMYYNLTNIHAVLRMAPFGESLARSFNQFVGARDVAPSPDEAVAWSGGRFAESLEVARIALSTAWQYLLFRRRLETFEREADWFAGETRHDRLATATLHDLAAHLRGFIEIRQHRWKNASLADAAAMVCYSLLHHATKGVSTDNGDTSLHNRLLCALPGVPSGLPPVRVWALSRLVRQDASLATLFAAGNPGATLHAVRTDTRFARFRREFDRYLDDWGFRSSSELMLTVPSLQEDPRPLVELIARHAAEDRESPEAAMARQAAARAGETWRVLRRLALRAPHRALAFWGTLAATRRSIAFRERARLKQALLYSRCRTIALEIGRRLAVGGRLDSADQIFMLRWEEIDELLSGRAMFPEGVNDLVRTRAREHARLSSWTPSDTFVLDRGDHWRPGIDEASNETPRHSREPVASGDAVLSGTSACGGTATAPAAVLSGVDEAHRLRSGDVLVTRQTDPGWAPVFCLISGLVIERGGMLSHGAVIAREFGLPCVVGVPQATTRIPHGRMVTVDGDAGLCAVREPATGAAS
jgi:pyruvate,water dikinase